MIERIRIEFFDTGDKKIIAMSFKSNPYTVGDKITITKRLNHKTTFRNLYIIKEISHKYEESTVNNIKDYPGSFFEADYDIKIILKKIK